MKTLLKNGTVVSGDMSVIEDVLIDGEKIVKVGRNLEAEDAQVVDVNGKLLFPGFIDGHTHFDLEVAGTVTADDFETGTRAAIAGGTTLVIDYASQDKGGHTLREGLEKWHEKADGKCSCDYSFHMSIVEWNEETQREIQDMINEGITSFKLYMTYPAMIVDDGDLYKIIKKLNEYGCFAGVHCENAGAIDALIAEAKKEGRLGPENHPLVRPDIMEAEAVHRLLVIADAADAPVMVVHLTNRKAFEEVMRARMNGQRYMRKPVRSICFWMTVYIQNRILKVPNTCVHLQSVRKQIRTACGKHWRMIRSRRLQLTSAALQWSRKLLVKMISRRFREGCREYRREELCFIHTVYAQAGSRRNRCAVC